MSQYNSHINNNKYDSVYLISDRIILNYDHEVILRNVFYLSTETQLINDTRYKSTLYSYLLEYRKLILININ